MGKKRWGLNAAARTALTAALAMVLVLTSTPAAAFAGEGDGDGLTHTLTVGSMAAFALGSKTDGEEVPGDDPYFTLMASAKMKIEDKRTKKFADGDTLNGRISFGATGNEKKESIRFTTAQDEAQVTIWWALGKDGGEMAILDKTGKTVAAATSVNAKKDNPFVSKLTLSKKGTYFLTCKNQKNYVFKVQVHEGPVVRGPWADVSAPELKAAEQKDGDIVVTADAAIGLDGGDNLSVDMMDAAGNVVKTQTAAKEGTEQTVKFTPSASGVYTFRASLSREKEESVKAAAEPLSCDFILPLTAPEFKNATNKGAGAVSVKFYSVKEATAYTLSIQDGANAVASKDFAAAGGADKNTATEYAAVFEGLEVGKSYTASVMAKRKRGETIDTSEAKTLEFDVSAEAEQEWSFAAFGTGVTSDDKYCGSEGSVKDGAVTVWDTNSKGKLVPASTDGLSFYYTAIPANKNFTLSATAAPDGKWTFTNGQEGFGLMAADRVGTPGDSSSFWNNSYMASVTKVEYFYDPAARAVTDDSTKEKFSMKLGIGSQEKSGVTAANIANLENNDLTGFSSKMTSLETSAAEKGTGTYNVLAGGFSSDGKAYDAAMSANLSSVRFTIQKNNTGYFVSYTDAAGNTTTKKYYDTKALEQIDKNFVYAGFYASRSFRVKFTDISLTLTDPANDAPAEERPAEYVTPNYQVLSAGTANKAAYTLSFRANADGKLTVAKKDGTVLADGLKVWGGKTADIHVRLAQGVNTYTLTFTPDADYHPGGVSYKKLSSYDTASFDFSVDWKGIGGGNIIHVSQNGVADAAGTADAPVDIYTAVKYVRAGQTIRLAPGTYKLSSPIVVARGIDGTASAPIRMEVAQTGSGENRAVFDFQKKCQGIDFVGNYWYVKDIDCTNSGNALHGITLSGSHDTFENVRTYNNGNTGFQISRYMSSDSRSQWPSYDLIKNCTSFANADKGYEDADGFAAKLTVGDGIVFDGCMAYNNADDGWDLFAKVETGNIGAVTIKNCMAFNNGFGLDGTDEGNGNGFKMGGSSITGYHHLINSVAFGNKAKGIDSNSCPDIQVTNSTSFNNGSFNVAFYTNDAKNTDFCADGVLSFRTDGGVDDQFKLKGSQNKAKVYSASNFYGIGGKTQNFDGTNEKAIVLTADMFENLRVPAKDSYRADPLSVMRSFRAADGRIDIGNLLQLTDSAKAELKKAGIDTAKLGASLNGKQAVYTDASRISGREAGKDTGMSYNGKSLSDGSSSGGGSSRGGSGSSSSGSSSKPSDTNGSKPSGGSISIPAGGTVIVTPKKDSEKTDTGKGGASTADMSKTDASKAPVKPDAAALDNAGAGVADAQETVISVPGNATKETIAAAEAVAEAASDPGKQMVGGTNWNTAVVEEKQAALAIPEAQAFIASHAGQEVSVTVTPKIAVEVKKAEAGKVVLEITPKVEVAVSAGGETKTLTADQKMKVKTAVRVAVPVPAKMAEEGKMLYISHKLDDGRMKYYRGKVTSGILSFYNPDGFSEFTITETEPEGFVDSSVVPVYRLLSPVRGDHLYTTSMAEAVNAVSMGWNQEGVGFTTPVVSDTPVYRLYNPYTGMHLFTTGADERDALAGHGWNYEGIAFYSGGTVAAYRAFNPGSPYGQHNWTTGVSEQDSLKAHGWNDEGVAFYSY